MAHIIESSNPFNPLEVRRSTLPTGVSIRDWENRNVPANDFPRICLLNGRALMRKDWGVCPKEDDVVCFVSLPQGETVATVALIISIVLTIASIAVPLLLPVPRPKTPGETPTSDPVFSSKGKYNAVRLGEPIEVSYGRNRIYPSLAARPYFQYRNNDQFQYVLFCIGQGAYDIHTIQIGDTPIDNFQEVEYEVIPPGAAVSLFPVNVHTSVEVGGQTLLASNEPEYTGDGWVGPFPANPAGTQTEDIQIDLVFPEGLYHIRQDGSLSPVSIDTQVQAREIDDDGDPVGTGEWYDIFASKKVETYVSTRREGFRRVIQAVWERYTIWSWNFVSSDFVPVETGDPEPGTTVVEYDDSYTHDEPNDREGTIKTITTTLVEAGQTFIRELAATTTPQRRTYATKVTLGRYEVRARRVDERVLATSYGHVVVWEGLRSFLFSDTIDTDGLTRYGVVTLLAVIVRATNNLNEQTAAQFNVTCTRKLPIGYSGGIDEEVVPSRSIVWAFVDVFRNAYGGRVPDGFFDLEALLDLDAEYEKEGRYFDWHFRDPITVWEAAAAIARVGRATPLLVGSQITMRRTVDLSVPITIFNQDNIIKGSFQWDIKLWDLGEFDSIQMEYTEPATGYLQEQVLATLPGGTTNNPQRLRLPGCQDRTFAYREALHLLAIDRYLRENVSFNTGLEGMIPSYGDLIGVSHDVPRWGQAGYVVHAVVGPGASEGYFVWVSQPLVFESAQDHKIWFRGREAEVIGPLNVFETEDPQKVFVSTIGQSIDFLLGGANEPMLFIFGLLDSSIKYMRVVKMEPQGGETVRITAVNDNSIIFSFDELDPPALGQFTTPPVAPALPVVGAIRISQISGPLQIIQIAWLPAFGTKQYVVQTSEDNSSWQERGITTRLSIQTQVRTGTLYVRVAAINEGQGPWSNASIIIGLLRAIENHILWEDELSWGIRWWNVLNAAGFRIKVYNAQETSAILLRTVDQGISERSFLYNYDMAVEDGGVVRDMLVTVQVLAADEDTGDLLPIGTPVELELSNSIPSAPLDPGSEAVDETSDVVYRLFWGVPTGNDLFRLVVWLSTSSGFDPAETAPYYDEEFTPGAENIPSELYIDISLDTTGGHDAYYWRAAVFDIWGQEVSTNVTEEQTIPAYVPT